MSQRPAYKPTPHYKKTLSRSQTIAPPMNAYKAAAVRFLPTRPAKKLASQQPPIVGTVFQKTFENMEGKQLVEFTGVVSAVYQSKTLNLKLINTPTEQSLDPFPETDADQLLAAGFEREVMEAFAQGLPSGVFLPLTYDEEGFILKLKVAEPDVLSSLKDEEAEYGYRVGDYVRVTAKSSTWFGWKGDPGHALADRLKDSAGISFYVRSVMPYTILP